MSDRLRAMIDFQHTLIAAAFEWARTESPSPAVDEAYCETRDVFNARLERLRQAHKNRGLGETAEVFADSVGVGSYRIDLHPSTGGDNYIDVSSLPFQIPMGALIPRRMENLLPAAKNLGVTHITNGCYRLHPVEWNIGEAAGVIAAEAVATGETPRQLRKDEKRLRALQAKMVAQGMELAWPKVTPR